MTLPIEEEGGVRTKRQGAEEAIELALESKWEEAVTLNQSLVEAHARDVNAWNRLGKALLELGRLREARDAYGRSLELDPVNSIAKRNLDRLATVGETEPPRRSEAVAKVAQDLFIEETGKSGATILEGASPEILATMTAGDEVYLKPSDKVISIENVRGDVLGTMEPKLGLRLIRLIDGGSRYAAAVKSVGDSEAELIIKETYRDPSQTRLSFPATGGEGVRPYTRESLLRRSADDEEDEGEEDAAADWEEPEAEPANTTVSLSRLQRTIEPEEDDEDEDQ